MQMAGCHAKLIFLLVMNVIRIKIRVEKAHEVFKKNKMEKREDIN